MYCEKAVDKPRLKDRQHDRGMARFGGFAICINIGDCYIPLSEVQYSYLLTLGPFN